MEKEKKQKIKEEDFYIENNLIVFTETYHKKRGKCCNNKCKHCPYKEKNS